MRARQTLARFEFGSACLIALCVGLAQSGCGDGLPKTYPVRGKVIFKGGKPMTSGTVMVQSVTHPDIVASGDLGPDGSFELHSSLGKPGMVEGELRVLIEPPLPEYGEKAAVGKSYQRFETSGITIAVTPEDNDVTIEIDPNK
jgi:hypothetical protein